MTSMNPLMQIKPTTRRVSDAARSSPLRLAFCLVSVVLACFGLSPCAQAGTSLGAGNTADGAGALNSLTTGIHNTAEGYQALFSDTIGSYNTATGSQALKNTVDGAQNTADGFQALIKNTIGNNNVATGWRALFQNTTGNRNIAIGAVALNSNTGPSGSGIDGSNNVAVGHAALFSTTTGNDNTALGFAALLPNITGFLNTALGSVAGSLTTGNNNIDIANQGAAGESNTIRIGTQVAAPDIFGLILPKHTATYIAGISGVTLAGGVPVVVDTTTGQLGIAATSSQRFKDEIKPMDKASEAILALKPVTFRYKKELDPKSIPQFGLVAEEVQKVSPALVTRDADGKPYTVRYEAVNAMLLNEFLKEHGKVEKLEATAAQQQKEIKALTAALKEQAAQIQKVSAQLEVSKPAPQIVVNAP